MIFFKHYNFQVVSLLLYVNVGLYVDIQVCTEQLIEIGYLGKFVVVTSLLCKVDYFCFGHDSMALTN